MHSTSTPSPAYKLPPEVLEFCEVAKRIVREELVPLEQEWLASPHQAFSPSATESFQSWHYRSEASGFQTTRAWSQEGIFLLRW